MASGQNSGYSFELERKLSVTLGSNRNAHAANFAVLVGWMKDLGNTRRALRQLPPFRDMEEHAGRLEPHWGKPKSRPYTYFDSADGRLARNGLQLSIRARMERETPDWSMSFKRAHNAARQNLQEKYGWEVPHDVLQSQDIQSQDFRKLADVALRHSRSRENAEKSLIAVDGLLHTLGLKRADLIPVLELLVTREELQFHGSPERYPEDTEVCYIAFDLVIPTARRLPFFQLEGKVKRSLLRSETAPSVSGCYQRACTALLEMVFTEALHSRIFPDDPPDRAPDRIRTYLFREGITVETRSKYQIVRAMLKLDP